MDGAWRLAQMTQFILDLRSWYRSHPREAIRAERAIFELNHGHRSSSHVARHENEIYAWRRRYALGRCATTPFRKTSPAQCSPTSIARELLSTVKMMCIVAFVGSLIVSLLVSRLHCIYL